MKDVGLSDRKAKAHLAADMIITLTDNRGVAIIEVKPYEEALAGRQQIAAPQPQARWGSC